MPDVNAMYTDLITHHRELNNSREYLVQMLNRTESLISGVERTLQFMPISPPWQTFPYPQAQQPYLPPQAQQPSQSQQPSQPQRLHQHLPQQQDQLPIASASFADNVYNKDASCTKGLTGLLISKQLNMTSQAAV